MSDFKKELAPSIIAVEPAKSQYKTQANELGSSSALEEKVLSIKDPYTPAIKYPDAELSTLSITSLGIIEENWDMVTKVPARIIEATETQVRLECIIDVDNRIIQERSFERGAFGGDIPLNEYQLVMIKIFVRPGKMSFELINGNGLVQPILFIDDPLFADLKGSRIDKPMR